jgi:cysteine desulfuration protein SufE
MDAAPSSPATIEARFAEVADTFDLLGDWEERYRHVIDLGRNLPALPEVERTEANKVRGCASQVWLVSRTARSTPEPVLRLRGDSDAHIVRGLIALVLALFDGAPPAEILAFDASAAFERLGLTGALSRQRANGLASMVERIRHDARALADASGQTANTN